jgi:hypothetical protein
VCACVRAPCACSCAYCGVARYLPCTGLCRLSGGRAGWGGIAANGQTRVRFAHMVGAKSVPPLVSIERWTSVCATDGTLLLERCQ